MWRACLDLEVYSYSVALRHVYCVAYCPLTVPVDGARGVCDVIHSVLGLREQTAPGSVDKH